MSLNCYYAHLSHLVVGSSVVVSENIAIIDLFIERFKRILQLSGCLHDRDGMFF